MKKKLSKILGVGLTIALVASLMVIAAPVSADPAYTEIGASFRICANGDDAQWRTTQVHPSPETLTAMGVSSAWLDKDTGGAGSTGVQFVPPAGTTFSDFQAAITAGTPKWSFWHWLETTVVTNGPQFELRFEDPNSTGWLEVTAVGLQGTTGTNLWVEEILAGTTPAGYGGVGETGTSFFKWAPLTALSGIEAAVNTDAAVGTASDWVLERVRVELWEAINQSCYIDDITIDGERYDLEQSYRIIPETVAKDVKGTEQKFVILNLPMGMSDIEFLTYANPAQAMEDAQTDNVSLEVVSWQVIPGLEKSSVGPPGSGADIIITGGGGPTYTGGAYTGSANPQNWIKVWTRDPGDANIVVWLDKDLLVDSGAVLGVAGVNTDGVLNNDEDIRLITEKKWGDINHTILDLDPATPIVVDPVSKQLISGQETLIHYVAGTVAAPEYELVDDWIYAWFYKSPVPSTFIDSVGHAVVHWWLIVDDAAGLNEAAIDAIMANLGSGGCGTYADWPAAWGTPFSAIDAVATANPSTKFTFSDVTEGTLAPDPNVDGTFNVLNLPYIKTMTEDDLLGETRGLVQVQLENTGQEDVLIVTLSEYPWPYAGENPVCIEKGRKTWIPVPPPSQIKTTQVRWAGEKIVLEKDWGVERSEQLVMFALEEGSIGDLIPIDPASIASSDSRTVFTAVGTDGVARVMFKTEQQGQVDVECVLYSGNFPTNASFDEIAQTFTEGMDVIENTGFLVYYLFLEEVTPWEPEPAPVDPADSAAFAVDVKGCFWTTSLPGTTREARIITFEVDGGGTVEYELPAGRYVLPDDWPLMAGPSWRMLRPWMDLMADPDNVSSLYELGPYIVVNSPSGVAALPCIGPFSSLQQWSTLDMWITDAMVLADNATDMDPFTAGIQTYALRNTVIPDDWVSSFDCPMPPAEIHFVITASVPAIGPSLSDAFKDTGPTYDWPFYASEIPANRLIPPMLNTVEGYWWDSWEFGLWSPEGAYTPNTPAGVLNREGPYWFHIDLEQTPSNRVLEAYSDNLGTCAVFIDALGGAGSVTIKAFAEYPYLPAKFPPVESDEVTQVWGAIELNPHFVADKIEVAVDETVTFDNLTAGGTWPYTKAQWDFDADGVIDETIVGTHAAVMADVTWAYDAPNPDGYSVILWMTDTTPTTRYEERPDYIVVIGEVGLPGDANGDGVVNALDITYLEMIIAGLETETPGADANQDGVVNALDITYLEMIIAGLV